MSTPNTADDTLATTVADAGPQEADQLLECLAHVSLREHRELNRDAVCTGLPLREGKLTPSLLLRAAPRAGFKAKLLAQPPSSLGQAPGSAILLLNNQAAVVLESWDASTQTASVFVPEQGLEEWTKEQLAQRYSGHLVLLRPRFEHDDRAPQMQSQHRRHWFWGALFQHRKLYRDALVAAFMINSFAVAMPLFVMNVYDRVVPNEAVETLWVFAAGLAIVLAAELALRSARAHFVDLAGNRVDRDLSTTIMQAVLGMRLQDRPESTGSFAANLRAFEVVRDFVTAASITTLIDLPFALIFVGILAWIAPPLAIPLIIGATVLVIHSWSVQSSLRYLADEGHRSGALRNATLVESLVGLEDIKSQGAQGLIQRRWEQVTQHLAHNQTQLKLLGSSVMHGALFVQQCTSLGIVVLGVYLIMSQQLSMGGLIAAMMLTSRAMQPLAQLAGLMTQYHNAKTALLGLDPLLGQGPPEPAQAPINRPNLQGGIELKEVSFQYPRSHGNAVRDISLRIAPGEKVAILGRAGSGKSTLLRLILGLYQPQEGSVRLDGIDTQQLAADQVRKAIGYISQQPTLLYGSLRENLLMGRTGIADQALLEAAYNADLKDMIDTHPQGFDMHIGERGESLSGGQRQAVALARGLVGNPNILLLDEPTSALDNGSEERVRSRLKALASNKTLVLVTHRTAMLDLVDRIIVLDQGRLMADGPKDTVLEALRSGRVATNQGGRA